MATRGRIRLGDVQAMLKDCAPGHRVVEKKHHWWVYFREKSYRTLPKGKHGKRQNPEIESGHVKKLANHLEIAECAARHFPDLFPKQAKANRGQAHKQAAAAKNGAAIQSEKEEGAGEG